MTVKPDVLKPGVGAANVKALKPPTGSAQPSAGKVAQQQREVVAKAPASDPPEKQTVPDVQEQAKHPTDAAYICLRVSNAQCMLRGVWVVNYSTRQRP
jgi:hypothetical protein